jgi:hypothetical protein
MVELGEKIGAIDETFWGSRTEAEFLEVFKNGLPPDKLKAAYKQLPKPKKKKVVKKKSNDGSVLNSGES